MTDGAGLEETRRELVEERLKGVVVVLVDEHDLRVGVLELTGRAHAGEAAAEDEHPRTRAHPDPSNAGL